ncbi:non-ribosomal peptide synthetase [Kordiimonas aestuarii]|uniref:non-ribosomal peptide synthetase n=1 Tax=Kordiimonas aestuarii TaxID=1005925 RepID=UPI0021D2AB64|nr:non-ribosomal peptide synthetase [Kordiimonas aestuarii]
MQMSDDRTDHLVAFVTGSARYLDRHADWDACNTALRANLPDYMIPQEWVTLEALPSTNNNKVDRVKLASLYAQKPAPESRNPVPENDRKKMLSDTLANIAASVIKRTASELDFAQPLNLQGFDSVAVIKLTELLNETYSLHLSPVDLYNAPTLEQIRALLPAAPRPAPAQLAAEKPSTTRDSSIAIIGMSGQMPGADDLAAFWDNLEAGRVSITDVPDDRWTEADRAHGHKAGFLSGIDLFDAPFFGMTNQEAASTDPQQRLFTLNCYRALEDAGIDPNSLKGRKVGVYAGAALGDYQRLLESAEGFSAFSMIGMSPSIIPARIAFQLDLKGPTETVDTACSSALVSVHNAVKALQSGDIEMAMAGGVYLMTTPLGQMISAQAGIIASDGRCKPFDERANGIVIGEAVGVLTLKRLEDAIRDNDPIRAVIRGAAVNQDGRTNGITAPSSTAQAALIGQATDIEGVSAKDISYVECHGTGTRLGDPIEIEGLRQASLGDRAPCWIGSVKANVGHCYQAAGVVGLIKVVLSLEHQRLPGQPDFGEPNPLLKLEGSGLRVLDRTQNWDVASGERRIAGVSAFGFSGTNAHVLIEEWPAAAATLRPQTRRAFNLASYWASPAATNMPAPQSKQLQLDGVETAKKLIMKELSSLSGIPTDEIAGDASLEADIGMDSIKLMGLMAKLGRVVDLPTIDAAGIALITTVDSLLAVLPSSIPDAHSGGASEAKKLIMAEFSALSGLPASEIKRDACLEADIGMDSIKLMGLVARLSHIDGITSIDSGNIARIVTVGDLLDAVCPSANSSAQYNKANHRQPDTAPHTRDTDLTKRRLPVSIPYAEYLFLLGHHLIRSSSLCSWLRLAGPLDPVLMQKAWQLVVDQQPGSRLVFERRGETNTFSDYQAVLLQSPKVPAINLTDLSDLTPEQQEKALQEAFDRALNAEWSLEIWPLHRFDVYRLSPNDHAVFLVNEHCVSDGIGNQRLLSALMLSYQALAGSGKNTPPANPVMNDAEFVRLMAGFNEAADHLTGPMPEAGEAPPYFWNPGGRKIENFQPDFTVGVKVKSRPETKALVRAASTFGMSLNQLLVLAMARATHATSGDDSVSVQMPTGGRNIHGLDAHDLVCCLAQNLPVDFADDLLAAGWGLAGPLFSLKLASVLAAQSDWRITKAMAETIAGDIPLEPEALRGNLRPLFRGRLRSNIYVPYIGDTGLEPAYADLKITAYRAGTVNGPATVDVLHEIFDGQLHGSWNYDRGFFTENEIEGLCEAFDKELAAAVKASLNVPVSREKAISGQALPLPLIEAVETVLGRTLRPEEAEGKLDQGLGFDSLQRIRLLSKLPAEFRSNVTQRAAFLTAPTLIDMARLMGDNSYSAPGEKSEAPPRPDDLTSATPGTYDFSELPISRIVKQMTDTPDAVAVTSRRGQLTYAELNGKSRSLASYLISNGLEKGDRVGLLMGRSRDFIASVIGVLRAGLVYVPLDPDLPKDRLGYIINHARLSLVIYAEDHENLLNASVDAFDTCPDAASAREAFAKAPLSVPGLVEVAPEDPMLVLYTSGSTGRPKGVQLNHGGYANRLAWHQKQFQLKPGEGVLHKTTICFDVSVWEIFWPLMYGGTLHAVGSDVARDPWALTQIMRDNKIAVLHFVPSMFGEFLSILEADTPHAPFSDLRWVVLSGEALPVAQVRKWFQLFGDTTKLANLYGPTEASIDVTCQVMTGTPPSDWTRVPIGAAIDNVELLIMDDSLTPVKDGEDGELFIGGIQVADGYLHAKELTDKAFFDIDPDGRGPRRFYKTGDLVRRLPDGAFDHLGRLDSQVKLRGYRIELGEIEAILGDRAQVHQVVVLVADGAIVAHIAGDANDPQSYLHHCALKLPAYMMPQTIKLYDRLPINANGKLDRRAIQAGYVEPGTKGSALLPAQSWMLQHFPAPYRWWGTSRFTVNRALDMERVKVAFASLAARHDALRTVYDRAVDGNWYRRVIPISEIDELDVRIIDVQTMGTAKREEMIAEAMYESCKAYSLDLLPLDTAMILREAPDRYTFCLANHHVNGDFVSGTILFRDFWALYDGMELAPPARQQGDLVDLLERIDLDADREYWKRLNECCQAPPSLLIGPEIDNLEHRELTSERCLTSAQTKALSTDVRAQSGTALYPVLAAAFYIAVAELFKTGNAILSHRMMGRVLGDDLPDFTETVGNFAVHFPLLVEVDTSLTSTANRVAKALAAVPHGGISYDWLASKAGGAPDFPYPDERLTPLRLNYLGQVLPRVENEFEFNADQLNQRFAPDDLPRSAEIEIHLSVEKSCLFLRARFVEGRHDGALINRLLDRVTALLGNT